MFFPIFFYLIITCSLQALDDSHYKLIKQDSVPEVLKNRVTEREWSKMDEVKRIQEINEEVKLDKKDTNNVKWLVGLGAAETVMQLTDAATGGASLIVTGPVRCVTTPLSLWTGYDVSQTLSEKTRRATSYKERVERENETDRKWNELVSYHEYKYIREQEESSRRKEEEYRERWGEHEYQSISTADDTTHTTIAERKKKKREELEKALRLKIFNENPDDIEKKGNWVVSLKKASFDGEEDINVFLPRIYNEPERPISYKSDNNNQHGFSKYGYIRRRDFYQPHNYSPFTKHKVVVIVVHGTWGDKTPDFYDDQNPNNLSYRHIKRYAASLGEQDQAEVILESFQWQGKLEEVNRENAAFCLKEHINEHYPNEKVFIITHSHGGNVVSQVTHCLDKPVNTLVYFACPIRLDHAFNRPHHTKYKNLIYFHSDPDMISFLGRLREEPLKTDWALAASGAAACGAIGSLSNYEYRFPVVCGASTLGTAFVFKKDLEKIIKQESTFPEYPGKTMIGIHVLFNGRGVGHSSIDSYMMGSNEIMNVTKYLPELMAELKNKYSHCFGKAALLEADFHPADPHNPFTLSYDTKHSLPKFDAD